MPSLRVHLPRLFVLAAAAAGLLLIGLATGAEAARRWTAPLRPVHVTRGFEPPPNPYAAGHRGVDLGGAVGQPVAAAAGGEVSFAGVLAGRGVIVVVHGVLRTTYEPVTALVSRGAQVRQGQEIGTLEAGHAGCPVSACLHWGLLRGQEYLDPLSMLGRGPVRLLPLGAQATVKSDIDPTSPGAVLTTANPNQPGPSPIPWSVTALAGGGVIVALRRR